MADEHNACARCAAVNPTCCRMDPAAASLCFPLSEPEWERLAPFAAREAGGTAGRMREENTPEFVRAMRNLFPDAQEAVIRMFPLPGAHYRLATTEGGTCAFLRPDGCFLPRAARPWYCRLFPIWIRKGGFDHFAARRCVIAEEARRVEDVLAAAGLTRDDTLALYRALCRDWGF